MAKSSILSRLERKLTRLPIEMEKRIIPNSVKRTQQELEDTQAFQMQLGKTVDGLDIGVLKNPAYGRRKKRRGGIAPEGMVDLRDTGAFQEGIRAQIVNDGIFLDSVDKKRDDLVEKYGEDIFGLNEDSLGIYRQILTPVINFEVQRYIDSA